MAGGLPLGVFARQRRDFAHEQCVWNTATVKGTPAGHEQTVQLWNNANQGWVINVFSFRVVSDPAGYVGIGWIKQEISPGFGAIGLPARADIANQYGLIETVEDSPINFAPQFLFDATAQGLQYQSESPLFIIPAGYGLFFDFNTAPPFLQVELLYATSMSVTAGRTDLT